MTRAIRRWSFVLGWNLVAAALIVELGGRALHWADHGTLRMRAEAPAANPAPVEPFSSGDVRPLLHPYFGFVYGAPTDPGADRSFYVNNHSFVQDRGYVERHPGCCEFPVTRRAPDEVIVGIFGGSVAGAVAVTAQQDDLLARLLAAAPAFAGKRIRVLNFAVGAHKQPQQLAILAYYLSIGQKLDAVIDIDGFNEVRVGDDNATAGVAPSFPGTTWRKLTQFVDEQATRPRADTLLAAWHTVAARDWERSAQSCGFGACYLVARTIAAWHRHGATMPPAAPRDARARTFFTIYPAPATGDAAVEQVADNWATSEILMHRLLAAQSTPFVVMLQPSRWYRPAAPLPAVGLQASNPRLARIVPPGYRALIARMPALRAQGVSVLDETALFDHLGADVYADVTAHFVAVGNKMMVAEVAKWMDGAGSARR